MEIAKEIALMKYIRGKMGQPFEWGVCDCNTLALGAMDAVYGSNLIENAAGRYASEQEAIEYRASSEWGSLEGLLRESGYVEGVRGYERTGDILIVDGPGFEMAHIYLGKKVLSVPLGGKVNLSPFALLKLLDYRVWRKA